MPYTGVHVLMAY